MRLTVIAASLLLVAGATTVASAQRTLRVPSQYATIQAAIIAAQDRDTVLVAPGIHLGMRFMGKAITVKSSGGPDVTKLRPLGTNDVVEFVDGETRAAVLEGFEIESRGDPQRHGNAIHCLASPTIRNNVLTGWRGILVNGSPRLENNVIRDCEIYTADLMADGAGILVQGGTPEIVGNLITRNLTRGLEDENFIAAAFGGGICVWGGNAQIVGNLVTHNQAVAESSGYANFGRYDSSGGGVFASSTSTVALINNVIAHNEAKTTLGTGPQGSETHQSQGGGVHGGALLVNNTILRNKASVAYKTNARGGGVYGATRVANCIVRENTAVAFPEIDGVVTVEHSNVKGGHAGPGNLDADPLFVDTAGDDFHLRHDSPCRDRGTNTVPGLPTTDNEGDPRTAGGTADVGADEFFPHLYHTGIPAPGATIQIKLIGTPGSVALWALSSAPLVPPVALPGLTGKLRLDPAGLTVVPISPFPATGVLGFPVQFPPGFPSISVPTQALMGTRLSNLDWVRVK